MKNQYEQQYNAVALKSMGIPVLKTLNAVKIEKIQDWVNSDFRVEITYPDQTERIINKIFEMFIEEEFSKRKKYDKFKIFPKGLLKK
jgi:phage-related protein